MAILKNVGLKTSTIDEIKDNYNNALSAVKVIFNLIDSRTGYTAS